MIFTDKIYRDFNDHTGIIDDNYKALFSKIEDSILKINDISFRYFKYSDTYNDTSTIVQFEKEKEVPLYVIEIIKNCFGNYYTLPNYITIEISVYYKGDEYFIVSTSEGTVIPDQLLFLKTDKLFNLFFITNHVVDVFSEYDNIFKFIDNFKTPIKQIYNPLQKKFEINKAKEDVVVNGLSNKDVVSARVLLDTYQTNMQEYLRLINDIRLEREELTTKRLDIVNGATNRDQTLKEKERIMIEISTINTSLEEFSIKATKTNDIIREIQSHIDYAFNEKDVIVASGNSTAITDYENNLNYLKDKKVIFEYEKQSVDLTIKKSEDVLRTLNQTIAVINDQLRKIEGYTVEDVTGIDIKIKELENKQDEYYQLLLVTENKVKMIKMEQNSIALKVEQSQSYTDSSIQNIETKSITNHLSYPLLPTPVITVSNYLRYYYAYYLTLTTEELMKKHADQNVYVLQAIASKLVLIKYFGITFNNLFSIFNVSEDIVVSKTLCNIVSGN